MDRLLDDCEHWSDDAWDGGPDQMADDPAYMAWIEKEDARGELAGSPEKIGCLDCGPDQPLQQVTKRLGPTPGPDPYELYLLACGHKVITFPDTPCE